VRGETAPTRIGAGVKRLRGRSLSARGPGAFKPAPLAASRHGLADRWLTIAVGLCAAGPVIASTLRALSDGWLPAGDQANIAIRAHDVFSSHTPLVGLHSDASAVLHQALYSLGPMLFWLLALPARFASPGTLALAMGVTNALAIVGVVALARRRGGQLLMFMVAIAVVVMCRSLTAEVFHDVWNPSAGLFPFTLLIFLCWSLACGEYRLLPVTVLVASFVVQCQLAFVPPALALLAVGLGGLAVSRSSPRTAVDEPTRARRVTPSHPWRWVLGALLVGVLCWTAPVIDQVDGHPGNLTRVIKTATAPTSTLGATVGWNAVVRAVGVPPWWLKKPRSPWERKFEVRAGPPALATVSCLLMLCALVAIAAIGLLRRRAALCAGALIALALCVALAVLAATTPSTHLLTATLGYTMWWGSPAGMFAWVIVGWSIATLLIERGFARIRVPALASGIGIGAAACTAAAVAATQRADYHLTEYRPLSTMYAGLDRAIPAGRTVLLTASLGNATFRFKMAARFAMARRGIRALSPGKDSRLGAWYELDHHRYDCAVTVSDGQTRPSRGATVVARVIYKEGTADYPMTIWLSRAGCASSRSR
jgi:hypothetical protein